MKRILSFLLCLLLMPCAWAENIHTNTVTSHFERYSITLPEGSVHYSLQDAARITGSTLASTRFNEVDCYSLFFPGTLNMQSMSTPFKGVFRSDMQQFPDSLVESFRASYENSGYPADRLVVALETIGAYPFVRIDVADDPSNITEYYTYGVSGTEFCFAFLGTSLEEEQAILATLQLAEPTEIIADYTETDIRKKTQKKLHRKEEDPFRSSYLQTFTSNWNRYTIDLPADTVHFTTGNLARHFNLTEAEMKLSQLDCYSIYTDNYIDVYTTLTNNMDLYPEDLANNADGMIEFLRESLKDIEGINDDSLDVSIVHIGSRDFLRAQYSSDMTAEHMRNVLDYITYDEFGTEYYFTFYSIDAAEAEAFLQTLQLLPPEKLDAESKKLRGPVRRSDEKKDLAKETASAAPTAQPADDGFTFDVPAGMLRLPDALTEQQMQSLYETAVSEGNNTKLWDEREERGTQFYIYMNFSSGQSIMIATFRVPDHTREELETRAPQVLELTRQDFIDSQQNPDDFLLYLEDIGDHPCQTTESLIEGDAYIEFCTVSRGGVQYNIAFVGFTPEDARAIMETLQIHE